MSVLQEFVVKLTADTDSFEKGMDKAGKASDVTAKRLERLKIGFATLGKAAVASATVLGAAMGYGVGEAIKLEKSNMRLFNSLINVGKGTEEAFNQVSSLAAEMSLLAGIEGDEIQNAFGQMVQITGDYEQSLTGLKAAIDMSAATGMDLNSTVRAIGMGMQGTTGMLSRYGVKIKEGADATEVLAEVTKRYAGAAEAMSLTLDGQMRTLKERIDGVAETVGIRLMPEVSDLLKLLGEAATFWEGMFKSNAFESFVVGARNVLKFVTEVVIPGIIFSAEYMWKSIQSIPEKFLRGGLLSAFGGETKKELGQMLQALMDEFVATEITLDEHKKRVEDNAKSYLKLKNGIKAAKEEQGEYYEVLEETKKQAFDEYMARMNAQAEAFTTNIDDATMVMTTGFQSLGEQLVATEGKMGEAWKSVAKAFLGSIIDAFMVRVSAQMALYTAQLFDPVLTVTAAAGLATSATQMTALGALKGGLTMFADGGIVNKATAGIFGEAGPEAIMPLKAITPLIREAINNTTNNGDLNVIVNAQTIDNNTRWDVHAKNIKLALKREGLRNGIGG